jgi:hypothetical protein
VPGGLRPGIFVAIFKNVGQYDGIAAVVAPDWIIERNHPCPSCQLRSRVHYVGGAGAGAAPSCPGQFNRKIGHITRRHFFPCGFGPVQHGGGMRVRVLN